MLEDPAVGLFLGTYSMVILGGAGGSYERCIPVAPRESVFVLVKAVQGLLEIEDTHRPWEGPYRPTVGS